MNSLPKRERKIGVPASSARMFFFVWKKRNYSIGLMSEGQENLELIIEAQGGYNLNSDKSFLGDS